MHIAHTLLRILQKECSLVYIAHRAYFVVNKVTVFAVLFSFINQLAHTFCYCPSSLLYLLFPLEAYMIVRVTINANEDAKLFMLILILWRMCVLLWIVLMVNFIHMGSTRFLVSL